MSEKYIVLPGKQRYEFAQEKIIFYGICQDEKVFLLSLPPHNSALTQTLSFAKPLFKTNVWN